MPVWLVYLLWTSAGAGAAAATINYLDEPETVNNFNGLTDEQLQIFADNQPVTFGGGLKSLGNAVAISAAALVLITLLNKKGK